MTLPSTFLVHLRSPLYPEFVLMLCLYLLDCVKKEWLQHSVVFLTHVALLSSCAFPLPCSSSYELLPLIQHSCFCVTMFLAPDWVNKWEVFLSHGAGFMVADSVTYHLFRIRTLHFVFLCFIIFSPMNLNFQLRSSSALPNQGLIVSVWVKIQPSAGQCCFISSPLRCQGWPPCWRSNCCGRS